LAGSLLTLRRRRDSSWENRIRVRRLALPEVLKSTSIAALATSLLCYPRLSLWFGRQHPICYLEAVIFFGSFVLWAFVFAWHTHYCHQPVFTFKVRPKLFALATLAAISVAAMLHQVMDPSLRRTTPEDFPADFEQWIAMTLFSLAFSQLFLIFAPFAWLLRLFKNKTTAAVITVLFGVFVLMLKTGLSSRPFPSVLLAALVIVRLVLGILSLFFYLRGGLLLVWWWGVLLQARHLVSMAGDA
jgi:hypothetical protein